MAQTMYNISFEINYPAESPLDAAKQLQALLEAQSNDWQYYVQNDETKEIFSVDLQEDDEDAVLPINPKDYTPIIH